MAASHSSRPHWYSLASVIVRSQLFLLMFTFVCGLACGIWLWPLHSHSRLLVTKSVEIAGTEDLPTIYVVTATYMRPEQRAELTRLCNTLARVPAVHWLVVEDAETPSRLVADTLADCVPGVVPGGSVGMSYTHLSTPTPPEEKPRPGEPHWWRPKGVRQRNLAFRWLRAAGSHQAGAPVRRRRGVMYIADDDNAYDVRVFTEMRHTRRASVWPVAFAGGLPFEGIRCAGGRVLGWVVAYKPHRPFPIDMAGFAINLRLLHERPAAELTYNAERGFQESLLLSGLGVRQADLEARADDCTRVLVWHTRTAPPKLNNVNLLASRGLTLPPIVGSV